MKVKEVEFLPSRVTSFTKREYFEDAARELVIEELKSLNQKEPFDGFELVFQNELAHSNQRSELKNFGFNDVVVNNVRIQVVLLEPDMEDHCSVWNPLINTRMAANFFVFVCDKKILGCISKDDFLMNAFMDDYSSSVDSSELLDLRTFYFRLVNSSVSEIQMEWDEDEFLEPTPIDAVKDFLESLLESKVDSVRDQFSDQDWVAIFLSKELSVYFLEIEKRILENAQF